MFKRPALRKRGHVDIDKCFTNLKFITVEPKPKVTYIKPIQCLDSYLRSMKYHGASDETIEYLRRRNTPGDKLNRCVEFFKPYTVLESDYKRPRVLTLPVKRVNDIVFDYEVIDGVVRVKVHAPFEDALHFIKHGKSVPKSVQVKCLLKCGVYKEDFSRVKSQLKRILRTPIFKVFKKI